MLYNGDRVYFNTRCRYLKLPVVEPGGKQSVTPVIRVVLRGLASSFAHTERWLMT